MLRCSSRCTEQWAKRWGPSSGTFPTFCGAFLSSFHTCSSLPGTATRLMSQDCTWDPTSIHCAVSCHIIALCMVSRFSLAMAQSGRASSLFPGFARRRCFIFPFRGRRWKLLHQTAVDSFVSSCRESWKDPGFKTRVQDASRMLFSTCEML